MVGATKISFEGTSVDVADLAERIHQLLLSEGFQVEMTGTQQAGYILQARKGGFLAEIIDAERALLLHLAPQPVTVTIGVGNWRKDLVVAGVETLLVSDLFLPLDLGEMAWNLEVEKKLARQIEALVAS
jgi:hypothetical protein